MPNEGYREVKDLVLANPTLLLAPFCCNACHTWLWSTPSLSTGSWCVSPRSDKGDYFWKVYCKDYLTLICRCQCITWDDLLHYLSNNVDGSLCWLWETVWVFFNYLLIMRGFNPARRLCSNITCCMWGCACRHDSLHQQNPALLGVSSEDCSFEVQSLSQDHFCKFCNPWFQNWQKMFFPLHRQ